MSDTIFPVILSGGSGTRLWPLSRSMHPKQFIRFFGDQKTSFLGATLRRLPPDMGFAPPIVMCNHDHRFLVREELEAASIKPKAIFLEPLPRNTAPAIAVAALAAYAERRDAVLVVMPSDHVIEDQATFLAAIQEAVAVAATGRLVLFGIRPLTPHTGYGYVRQGATIPGFDNACAVAAFTEKPDRETAERYLAKGGYSWNSGIFVLHAETLLDELQRLAPEVIKAAHLAYQKSADDLGFTRLDAEEFGKAPNISIDYAIMEKTACSAMLPLDVGWSDVGSWSSLWDIATRDDQNNFTRGDAHLTDTSNSYIHSERALVATIGVDNLIVVNTPDALLVADRSRAQDVSAVVQSLKQTGRKEHEQHLRNLRPWGYFETLSVAPRFQVKLLHVLPGAKLSMQMHHHRSEHWVVVKGTAKITIGDAERLVRENESVYIVATQWHRLENPGKVPLEIIEVQIGSYLGEDDIIRAADIYNRAAKDTK